MTIFLLVLSCIGLYIGYKFLKKPTYFITQGGTVDFKAIKHYGFFSYKGRLVVYLQLYNDKFVTLDNSISKDINIENIQKWVGFSKELPLYKILEMDKRLNEQPILQEFISKLKKAQPITDEFLSSLSKEGILMYEKYND